MAGWLRWCWWGLAVVGCATAVTLLVWVSVADPEQSSQVWGIAGSAAGIAALGVSLWQVRATARSASSSTASAASAPVSGVSGVSGVPGPEPVHADGGSNAARGTIRNSRAHDGTVAPPGTASAPTPGATPGPTTNGLSASGGSNAAGGDIDGSTAHRGPR